MRVGLEGRRVWGGGGQGWGRASVCLSLSEADRAPTPQAHPKPMCGGALGQGQQRSGKGREAAHHIRQVHNGLGEVAGEDHRLAHLLKLGGKRVGGGPGCFVPPSQSCPQAGDLTSWWSLTTISSTYLVSLCTVGWPRRTWGVGGHLESVPSMPSVRAKPWTGSRVLNSSQGQCQSPTGGDPLSPQPWYEDRQSQFVHSVDRCRHGC